MKKHRVKLSLAIIGSISLTIATVIAGILLHQSNNHASDFVKICSKTKNKDGCYVGVFTDFVKNHSISESLGMLHDIQQKDTTMTGCHFIAHVIASEEVKKHPERWNELFKQIPVDACTGGYLMGVLEGYYLIKPRELDKNRIEEICGSVQKSAPASSEHTCTHVMGHLLLAQSGGNIAKPLAICSQLKLSAQYECYNGVFMEKEYKRNVIAHAGGDIPVWTPGLIDLYQKECLSYSDKPAKSCWREISHMYVSLGKNYPPAVFSLCKNAPNELFQDECYYHAVGIMAISEKIKPEYIELLCKPYESFHGQYSRCVDIVMNTLSKSSPSAARTLAIFCSHLLTNFYKKCDQPSTRS